METLSEQRCHGGVQGFYRHESQETGTPMQFAVYLPPAAQHGPVPVLYYLAGLTCTEETATIKAGAQAHASRLGLALVMPDTSPRGASIEGEDDDWDFGTGAGFYLDATREPWTAHYRMYAYVTRELRALVASRVPGQGRRDRRIRPLDGRPRSLDHRAQEPGRVPDGLRVRSDLRPRAIPVGREGVPRLPGR